MCISQILVVYIIFLYNKVTLNVVFITNDFRTRTMFQHVPKMPYPRYSSVL